ncbi:MAG: aldo/keto reductase [Oscillospiraceae bacterium]
MRRQVFLQVHWRGLHHGEYGWTTELDEIKRSVAWQLENLQTDYIDFGFIHCLDEEADLRTYEKNGILRYLQDLQRQGVVRHLGLSSHAPRLANRVLDMRIIDMLMFSINPVYDYGRGEFAFGENAERYDLYRRCQKEGIGISVMKPFCGGQLLDAAQSPFKKALSKAQCIAYALDKPGVLTVLPGYGSEQELREVLSFLKRLRRSATMPKLPRLQLPPRSAPASTASTAIRVLPDSTLR